MMDEKEVRAKAEGYRQRGKVLTRWRYVLAALAVLSVATLCVLFGRKDWLVVPILLVITALVANWVSRALGKYYLGQSDRLTERAKQLRDQPSPGS